MVQAVFGCKIFFESRIWSQILRCFNRILLEKYIVTWSSWLSTLQRFKSLYLQSSELTDELTCALSAHHVPDSHYRVFMLTGDGYLSTQDSPSFLLSWFYRLIHISLITHSVAPSSSYSSSSFPLRYNHREDHTHKRQHNLSWGGIPKGGRWPWKRYRSWSPSPCWGTRVTWLGANQCGDGG